MKRFALLFLLPVITSTMTCEQKVAYLEDQLQEIRVPKKKIGFDPTDMVHPDREVIPPCLGAVCGEDDFLGKKP